MRMPTWRCSRTACCAAAIDFGRPTRDRQHHAGEQHDVAHRHDDQRIRRQRRQLVSAPCRRRRTGRSPAIVRNISASATDRSAFCKRDQQTAIDDRAAHAAVAAGRQPQPALEAALRQLQTMDDRGAQLGRTACACRRPPVRRPRSPPRRCRDRRRAARRAPGPRARSRAHRPAAPRPAARARSRTGRKNSRCMPLGAREHLARLRPHPIVAEFRHGLPVRPHLIAPGWNSMDLCLSGRQCGRLPVRWAAGIVRGRACA